MPESQRVRIEIGFDGGQVMSAYVAMSSADELEQALATGTPMGSFLLDAEDGRYTVVLAKIVYVKRFSREGRVGFSDS